MEALLGEIPVRTVLDCPFGTGRWIPQYDSICAKVIGVDLSQGMLDQARKKLTSDRTSDYHLVTGSIFELQQAGLPPQLDLTVCVRFLNWISPAMVTEALHKLSLMGSTYMIIGCSIRPLEINIPRNLKMQLALLAYNTRHFRSPRQYVHSETMVLNCLRNDGWRLKDKRFIFKNTSRENFFYLLERPSLRRNGAIK